MNQRLIIIGAVIIIGIGLVFSLKPSFSNSVSTDTNSTQFSVALSPDTKALGTVVYGDVTTTTFTLTNYTPLPLKITRVSTSCGCTKAAVAKEELAAYENTVVNVSFDPAVHKDDTDLGDLTRSIYIETDNPNFPQLESTITATVVKKQ